MLNKTMPTECLTFLFLSYFIEASQSSIVVPRSLKKSSSNEDIRTVLKLSTLQSPVPLWFASPEMCEDSVEKIAEGSFAQIFKIRKDSGEERIIKVIPVENSDHRSDIAQLTFSDILAEIYASVFLAKLNSGTRNRCFNFPNIYRICVTQGSFPKTVIATCRDYSNNHRTVHPDPEEYRCDQAFITIECDVGGVELTSLKMLSYLQAESVLNQVATSVAVAEEELHFEHRDLHVDNILVKPCREETLEVKFRNSLYKIETHGIRVTIIDFTFSRMGTGDDVKYLELDHIYDIQRSSKAKLPYLSNRFIYGEMENTTRSNWRGYYPKTNILWIKHVVENLLHTVKAPKTKISSEEKCARATLKIYNQACLAYDSVSEFVQELIL